MCPTTGGLVAVNKNDQTRTNIKKQIYKNLTVTATVTLNRRKLNVTFHQQSVNGQSSHLVLCYVVMCLVPRMLTLSAICLIAWNAPSCCHFCSDNCLKFRLMCGPELPGEPAHLMLTVDRAAERVSLEQDWTLARINTSTLPCFCLLWLLYIFKTSYSALRLV